jgi:hypothetical protein
MEQRSARLLLHHSKRTCPIFNLRASISVQALADEKVPEEAGSDGEGSDMDSFAKELEAALEEGDKDEEVAKKRDGRGFGRARQALQARVREEQLEDEEVSPGGRVQGFRF